MTSWSVLSQSESQPAEGAESSREFEHIVPAAAAAAAAAGLHETKAAKTFFMTLSSTIALHLLTI